MPEISKVDLLIFIHNQQEEHSEGLRFKALMEFCNCDPQGRKDPAKPAKCSYRTLMNYTKELMSEKLLNKKIDPESGRPLYYVTRKGNEKVKKQRMKLGVDSLPEKWITPLRNLIVKLTHETPFPEGFLNTHCITFIGDIPCTFPKSVEGMQSHIAFETSLHQRHQRDLEKFQDELNGTKDKVSWDRVDAKIKEEVGWSKGEYLKKLLKKAEKEEGIRKIMTVLGITDEMLEKMGYNQRSVDPGVQKRLEGGGMS